MSWWGLCCSRSLTLTTTHWHLALDWWCMMDRRTASRVLHEVHYILNMFYVKIFLWAWIIWKLKKTAKLPSLKYRDAIAAAAAARDIILLNLILLQMHTLSWEPCQLLLSLAEREKYDSLATSVTNCSDWKTPWTPIKPKEAFITKKKKKMHERFQIFLCERWEIKREREKRDGRGEVEPSNPFKMGYYREEQKYTLMQNRNHFFSGLKILSCQMQLYSFRQNMWSRDQLESSCHTSKAQTHVCQYQGWRRGSFWASFCSMHFLFT